MGTLQVVCFAAMLFVAGCVSATNQNGSAEVQLQLASSSNAEGRQGVSVIGGRSYISVKPLHPEYRDLGCYPGEFIKKYPSGTLPDPEALQVWQGEWEIWNQAKPASWRGGFIERGSFLSWSPTSGAVRFRGERAECEGCDFRIQKVSNLILNGWVIGKFLVIPPAPGGTRTSVYWHERQGENIFLFGSMWSPELNACYERRGIKVNDPPIKTAFE